MDQQAIATQFVKGELGAGITFAHLALTAKHADRLERNRANARKSLRYCIAVHRRPLVDA